MSNVSYTIREGDTEAVNFTLYSAGSGANITGYTSVTMYLVGRDGTELSFGTVAGDLTVETASGGACSISPAEDDFLAAKSVYKGYVVVVDGSGKRSSFPEDGWLNFVVLSRVSNDT